VKQDLFKEAIGGDRYLTVSLYKEELMVHIREYQRAENDRLFPTKKGVSFNKRRWATFTSHLDEIERKVELLKAKHPVDYSQHIGGGYYVTVMKDIKCVNIRRYWRPINLKKEVPTRTGIALRLGEWDTLLATIEQLHRKFPELKNASPCYASEDHANQMGFYRCTECNPFEYQNY